MSIEAPVAKSPKRARGVQRVAELLDAAAALFAEHGYETTTMTQIANRAGASIGSLYQFFPSKDLLAEALFARYVERVASMLEDLAKRAPGLSPLRLADRLVDLMLDARSDRDAAAALSGSVSGIVERRKPLRGATRRQIAAILRAANPKLRRISSVSSGTGERGSHEQARPRSNPGIQAHACLLHHCAALNQQIRRPLTSMSGDPSSFQKGPF
jgi:AcrR family transcriptional regulator